MDISTVLGVPPEAVFPVIADFERTAEWDPFVRESRLASGRALEVGAVYELHSLGGLTLRYELVAIGAPYRAVYRGGTENVTSTDTILVERMESGSRVTVTTELEFRGRMKWLAPLISSGVFLGGRLVSLPALQRHIAERSGAGAG